MQIPHYADTIPLFICRKKHSLPRRDTEGSCLQSRPPSVPFKPQSQIGNHLLWFLVYFPAMKISRDSWFPSLCFCFVLFCFFKHKDNLFYSFSPYSFHLQYIFKTLPKYTENSCIVISFSLRSIPVCVRVHKILASLKLMDAWIIPNLLLRQTVMNKFYYVLHVYKHICRKNSKKWNCGIAGFKGYIHLQF